MSTSIGVSTDKCSFVISQYISTKKLHPLVDQLSNDAMENFMLMLNHDVEVIKARSQDLDDHEITAAQKAFSLMVSQGNTPAAVAIYVQEVLGFNYVDPGQGMLEKLAEARRPLIENGKLQHLLQMCETAEKEFRAKRHGTYAQKEAAKFLCGTIENTINYKKSLGSSEQSSSFLAPDEAKIQSLNSLHSQVQRGLTHGFERKHGKSSKGKKQAQGRSRPNPPGEDVVLHGKVSKQATQAKDRSRPAPVGEDAVLSGNPSKCFMQVQARPPPALKREDAVLRSPSRSHPALVREDAVLRSPYRQPPRAVSPVNKMRNFPGIPRGGDRYRPTYQG
ncbi:MAG: hypothetical protein Q9191_000401 [Dirinaria sp. TL-2023a]